MADSSGDDSSDNLSVVSDEEFEISSSSEDSVREELAAIFFTGSLYRVTEDRNFTWNFPPIAI